MEEQLKQKTISLELVAEMESTSDDYYRPELKQFTETTQKALMLLSDKEDVKEDRELETVMVDDIKRASEPSSLVVHQFTKMKEIEPPTFNGDLTKFFEWKNLFVNLIHNCPPNEMGNTLKLYYLKKSMVGEVEGLLTDFNLSNEGYELRSVKKESYSCLRNLPYEFVVLRSAIIQFSCNGVFGKARVLLDNCSQHTLVSDLFVRKFKLAVQRSQPSSTSGVGKNSINSTSFVSFIVSSRVGDFKLSMDADIVPASSIAYKANFPGPAQLSTDIRKYPLADPAWADERLAIDRVDMIIGGKFYEQIICDDLYWVGELKLRNTQFGYTVQVLRHSQLFVTRLFLKLVHTALAKRGFQLRKYSSNSKELLEKIPQELLAKTALKTFEEEGYNQVVLGQSLPVKNKSSLVLLNPFLNGDGVMRVGGCLDRSEFLDDEKHPNILPAKRKDGLVRVVDVKFQGSIRSRSVSSIIVLPASPEPQGSARGVC
ncbi:hypothetical protein V9T40_000080 [Parthenolecanium corni]|uniref:Uncharacterized protein n=1 Tax=Parthenolecanium corni TaxID=536013 RepID=A0AAN9THT0_9HEMI